MNIASSVASMEIYTLHFLFEDIDWILLIITYEAQIPQFTYSVVSTTNIISMHYRF